MTKNACTPTFTVMLFTIAKIQKQSKCSSRDKWIKKTQCIYRLPRWHIGKESTYLCRKCKKCRFNPLARKMPWSRKWQPTPKFLPGKFRGQKSLAGCQPTNCKELGTQLSTHTQCRYTPRKYSVQFSRSVVSDSLRPHESQHARPPCPSPTPRVYSNSCPSSR